MNEIKQRLEYLRGELEAERISYEELAELQSLVEHIDPSDVQLLEAAGVPEEICRVEQEIAMLLWDYLPKDPEHPDRRQTGWGTKTLRGLRLSLERILKDLENNP